MLAGLLTVPLGAETAVLEAVADAAGPGTGRVREFPAGNVIVIHFRTWGVFRWQVDSADLFLHIASGPVPTSVEVAIITDNWTEADPFTDTGKLAFTVCKSRSEPQDWISVRVPSAMVEELAAGRAPGGLAVRVKSAQPLSIHARESSSFTPNLIVNGAK